MTDEVVVIGADFAASSRDTSFTLIEQGARS
jgi:hypothetical protein